MKYLLILLVFLCGCATSGQTTTQDKPNTITVKSWQNKHPKTLLITEANGVVFINGKSVYKLPPPKKRPGGTWIVYDRQLIETIKKRKGTANTCGVITSPQLAYVNLLRIAFSCGQAELKPVVYATGTSVIKDGSLKTIERQHAYKPQLMNVRHTKTGFTQHPPNDSVKSMVGISIFATQSGYIIKVGRNFPAIPIYPDCTAKTLRCINHSLDSVGRQLAKLRKRYKTAHFNIYLGAAAKAHTHKVIRVGQHISAIKKTSIMPHAPGELHIAREHFTYDSLDNIEMSYGICTKKEILAGIKNHKPKIVACLEQHIQTNEHIAGKWITSWNIKPDGSTSRISAKPQHNTQAHKPFEQCLLKALATMRFEPGQRVCSINYPFVFEK